jgi:UDP-N-acetylmuramyl-tripeptide synthetase
MSPRMLANVNAAAEWVHAQLAVSGGQLRTDSRQVQPGDVFIAWPGYAQDGRRFVASALKAGAVACLVEREGLEAFEFTDARVAALQGLKAQTGPLAAQVLGQPGHEVQVLAITGTNGKTSTAFWAAQALKAMGQACGVVGTLGVGVPPSIVPTGLTTPDPVALQQALRAFADAGVRHCAMEASSIGVAEHRLDGTPLAVALFTNFTRDHLDYHGSMEAYWQAKRALFDWPGLKAAVVNVDDPQGRALADELAAPGLPPAVWTCSSRGPARLQAFDVQLTPRGLSFQVLEGGAGASSAAAAHRVESRLIGGYNVDNLLGVMGALRALGFSLAHATQAVCNLASVPGRLERVGSDDTKPEVIVDYAHTPDALEKALAAVRPLAQARGGRLICVFGCGGNRDATKRPLMGAVAQAGADVVLLTSDNPRHEDAAAILAQVRAGITGQVPMVVENRRLAIAQAVAQAQARDVVLIAGKGHEDYQEVAGQKLPFSDVAEGQHALAEWGLSPVERATP